MGIYRNFYRKRSEATEQECLISWCKINERVYPELKLIFHIPNGGSRNKAEAAHLKAQGVKAGVPDLFLPVARCGCHGMFIEMKFGKNKATDYQKLWLEDLWKQGYKAVVCYSAEDAIKELKGYLSVHCPYEGDGREQLNNCRIYDDCKECINNWESQVEEFEEQERRGKD